MAAPGWPSRPRGCPGCSRPRSAIPPWSHAGARGMRCGWWPGWCWSHWWSRGMWDLSEAWLDRALRDRRGLRALDLGCGAGLTLARLVGLDPIGQVVGLEPSPAALQWASRHGHAVVRGSALELPFEGE